MSLMSECPSNMEYLRYTKVCVKQSTVRSCFHTILETEFVFYQIFQAAPSWNQRSGKLVSTWAREKTPAFLMVLSLNWIFNFLAIHFPTRILPILTDIRVLGCAICSIHARGPMHIWEWAHFSLRKSVERYSVCLSYSTKIHISDKLQSSFQKFWSSAMKIVQCSQGHM